MSKKEEIYEIEENEEFEVRVEEPKKGFLSKLGTGVKKHGKKIVVGAIVAGAAVAGFVLGQKKAAKGDSGEDEDYCDFDYEDSGETVTTEE